MFYVIGIMPKKEYFVEPGYLFDRWECIEADSQKEALDKYYELYRT
ncbi:hypothetical protein [Desulforamulus aeronauticus]|uniref:Uncharacterized protein n=1 Tax=Desulforamulus aeronauticus DSM 10349 TaxID=1121421 RepID=A0A1M6PCT6_9FIRM|nr:hypothetical protein [Desulforamulus aeronauticus]SHK05759.1 hypothetical protein SAMN02745123_00505 [Desulforamulus aeronauticus DSM 10349]